MHPSWLYGPTPLSLHKAEAIRVQKQNKCSPKMNKHPRIHPNPPPRQLARRVSFSHWPIMVFLLLEMLNSPLQRVSYSGPLAIGDS